MTVGSDLKEAANKALEELGKSKTDRIVERREREHGMNSSEAYSKKKAAVPDTDIRSGCLVPWGGPAGGGSSGIR